MPSLFGPDGDTYDPVTTVAGVDGSDRSEMPAWSPVTGDIIAFGSYREMMGVGAGCTTGNRWFTRLPIYFPESSAWVRPDGDIVVGSWGGVWVLEGATGDVLRAANTFDSPEIGGRPVTYHPGCGVLIEPEVGGWYWLNDDTFERGPTLRFASASVASWSGTADCGVVVISGNTRVTRLNADGTTRFAIDLPPPTGLASPPVPLADGGTMFFTDPPGWIRFDSEGGYGERVRLSRSLVGDTVAADTVLAPDGTAYFMTQNGGDHVMSAISTGAIPGPYLWRNSGLNWARTNSILPD